MEEIIISITKKEVETKLLTTLLNNVSQEGFVLRKKDNNIICKTNIGFKSLGCSILNYWPYCAEISSIGFEIRINQVEEIVNSIKARYNLFNIAFAKTTPTILNTIPFNIKVFTEVDIDKFIYNNINDIIEKAFLFFNRYADIAVINVDKKNMIIKNNDTGINSVARSLTLMKLCDDSDFDIMKIKYRQLLKPVYGQEKNEIAAYDDLVEYLSKM
jgi:hypothetical protein